MEQEAVAVHFRGHCPAFGAHPYSSQLPHCLFARNSYNQLHFCVHDKSGTPSRAGKLDSSSGHVPISMSHLSNKLKRAKTSSLLQLYYSRTLSIDVLHAVTRGTKLSELFKLTLQIQPVTHQGPKDLVEFFSGATNILFAYGSHGLAV